MLETPKERIQLLKLGVTAKTIERLYIAGNDIKIIHTPMLFELIEVESDLQEKVQSNQPH